MYHSEVFLTITHRTAVSRLRHWVRAAGVIAGLLTAGHMTIHTHTVVTAVRRVRKLLAAQILHTSIPATWRRDM